MNVRSTLPFIASALSHHLRNILRKMYALYYTPGSHCLQLRSVLIWGCAVYYTLGGLRLESLDAQCTTTYGVCSVLSSWGSSLDLVCAVCCT